MPSPRVSSGDFAEEGEHADVTGADAGDGTEEQDHEQEGRDAQADQAKQAAAVASAAVNHSAASWIKNRHRYSPRGILGLGAAKDKWLVAREVCAGTCSPPISDRRQSRSATGPDIPDWPESCRHGRRISYSIAMSKIHIPTPLRQYVGKQASVDVAGATVGEAMNALVAQHPDLRKHLYTDDGKLRAFVNLYLNDEDIRYLQKEATALKDGDNISIVPSIAGGAA